MALAELRLGASPTLPAAPSREDPFRTKKSPLSLVEASTQWKTEFGTDPVQLDSKTLRPLVFPPGEIPLFLRHVLQVANDGAERTPLFLELPPLSDPRDPKVKFSFEWERSSSTRRFDIVLPDMIWSAEAEIVEIIGESPLRSFSICDIGSDGLPIAPGARISGLRGSLEGASASMQRLLATDLVSVIHPQGKHPSFLLR